MNLVVIAAFIAVCGAAKLDRTYLPPSSADSAGGSPGSLQAPLTRSSEQAPIGLPTGSYTNDFGGVVVDAAAPGTRASGDASQTGLGGARPSYGSTDSKVGDAAFRGSVAGFRDAPSFGAVPTQSGHKHSTSFNQQYNPGASSFSLNSEIDTRAGQFPSNGPEINGQFGQAGQSNSQFQGFDDDKSERPQAAKDRNSNILTLSNEVNPNSYSYGFETDNGIAVGENGVAVNGIKAEGGYSYQGDDGQVYKVTYTADEGGYRPQGAHLPTPPPIPEDILKSLEQNAKEEAAGLVDDGSYDAQKYNTDGDYTHDNSGSAQHNGVQFGKRPESNAPAGAFNQNYQAYGEPGSQFGARPSAQNTQAFIGQSTQVGNTGSALLGVATNEQSNGKPGSEQFGFTGSQPAFNTQSSQVNSRPGLAPFGAGTQSTHSIFEQSTHENQFKPNPAFTQNVNSGSQGSHSSQSLSDHEGSVSGQTFGENTFSSTSDQAPGTSGNQAQFGYQYGQQTSTQFQSQSAESSPQQNQQGFNAQFGTKPSTPLFSHGGQQSIASAQFESQSPVSSSQLNQQELNAQFGSKPSTPSLSQGNGNMQSAQPQFGSSFKPQGSEAFSGASLNQDQDNQDFGKPSPQTFSGQNFNRPALGNYNKPSFGHTNKRPSTVNGFTRFPQAISQFGAVSENLSSLNSNSQAQTEKSTVSSPVAPSHAGTSGFNLNDQGAAQNYQISDFIAPGKVPGFASAFASTSFDEPAFQRQPVKPLNNFNTRPQTKPYQFTQPQTTQFGQQTNQLSSQSPNQFNTNSQYAGQKVSDFELKPTMVPDTELTTPLEPNESTNSQGSQFFSQTTSGFEPAINKVPAKFGQKGNSAFGQSISQTLPSRFPTNSLHSNSPFGAASTQAGFQSSVGKKPETTNSKPEFSENTFGQKQQTQGYYYKKPSLISQSVLPQGSKFPSSQSYQPTAINFQNQQSFQSPVQFSGSPSFTPNGPTSSPQFAQTQGYSGITQAAISPFPSVSPTPSSQYSMTNNGQFGTQPSFNHQSSLGNHAESHGNGAKPTNYNQQPFGNQAQVTGNQGNTKLPTPSSSRFPIRPISQINENLGSQTPTQFESKPESSDSLTQQQTTQTQQHQGPIYQYNKPSEVLPVPSQTNSSSSQSIQTGFSSDSKPIFGLSQANQLLTTQNLKPAGSFGNQPFGSRPSGIQRPNTQSGQATQISQETAIQFDSQQAQSISTPSSTNIQFGQSTLAGVQPAKPFGTTSTHFDSSPLGSPSQGIQLSFETKPQFSGKNSKFSQNIGSSRPFQPASGLGSIQNSGSSQDNGYVYPANPMPQFGEGSKNQFNHNSPSARPQFEGLNQFTQNTNSEYSQTTSFLNRPPSISGSLSQLAETQDTQNNQASFGQQTPNSPTQPQFAQPGASNQAGSGQGSASTSPQQYKPFGSQNTNQFGQKTDEKTQDQKPFDSDNAGSNEAPSSKPFGSSTQGSKPLFESACCQASKDSTPAQSAVSPTQTSFQGTNFNTQGFAGKGEQFGGPRQHPSFDDQTGYHY